MSNGKCQMSNAKWQMSNAKWQMSNAKCQMPKNPAASEAAWAAGFHVPAIRVTRPAAPPPAKKQTIIDDTHWRHKNTHWRYGRHYQTPCFALIWRSKTPRLTLVWRSKTPLGARKTLFRVRLALKKTTWRYQNHSRLMACRFSPKTTSARTQNNDLRHGQSPEGGRWNADGGWRMAEGGRRLRKRAPKGSRTGPLACRPKREAPLGAGV
jgi:hypothetical protein